MLIDNGTSLTASQLTSLTAIEEAAAKYNVPFSLAVATAIQESNLNSSESNGGLFQLNTNGGEGAGMTQSEIDDPYTNADTALAEFASVAQSDPALTSNYGAWAVAAQRPAEQVRSDYEADINKWSPLLGNVSDVEANLGTVLAMGRAEGPTDPGSYTAGSGYTAAGSSSGSSGSTLTDTPISGLPPVGTVLAYLDRGLNPELNSTDFAFFSLNFSTIARNVTRTVGMLVGVGIIYIGFKGFSSNSSSSGLIEVVQTGNQVAQTRQTNRRLDIQQQEANRRQEQWEAAKKAAEEAAGAGA